MFPDASKDGTAFNKWSKDANEIESKLSGTYFKVSDLLEQLAPDRDKEKGNDLADYLILHDWRKYRTQPKHEPPQPIENSHSEKSEKNEAPKKHFISENKESFENGLDLLNIENNKEDWSKDISQLQDYFDSIQLPTEPIQFNQCSKIVSVSKFVDSHLTIIKANNGKRTYKPYLNRLQELKQILTINYN